MSDAAAAEIPRSQGEREIDVTINLREAVFRVFFRAVSTLNPYRPLVNSLAPLGRPRWPVFRAATPGPSAKFTVDKTAGPKKFVKPRVIGRFGPTFVIREAVERRPQTPSDGDIRDAAPDEDHVEHLSLSPPFRSFGRESTKATKATSSISDFVVAMARIAPRALFFYPPLYPPLVKRI